MGATPTPLGCINMWTRASDTKTLQNCQLSYALGRMVPPAFEGGYLLVGTAFHLYAELRLTGWSEGDVGINALAMLRAQIAEAGDLKWASHNMAKDPEAFFFDFVSKFERDVMQPTSKASQLFNAEPILIEYDIDVPGHNYNLTTQVDSVWSTEDGGYLVIDWKTGSSTDLDPTQLWLYLYGLKHSDFGERGYDINERNTRLGYYHARHGQWQWVDHYPGDDYIEGLLRWTEDQKDRIVNTGYAPASPSGLCPYCPYIRHCPTNPEHEPISLHGLGQEANKNKG